VTFYTLGPSGPGVFCALGVVCRRFVNHMCILRTEGTGMWVVTEGTCLPERSFVTKDGVRRVVRDVMVPDGNRPKVLDVSGAALRGCAVGDPVLVGVEVVITPKATYWLRAKGLPVAGLTLEGVSEVLTPVEREG
jgi:hypothetical protein